MFSECNEMKIRDNDQEVRSWIAGDESAKQMLSRAQKDFSFSLLPPPLHRVPLRAGNVVEIVGPSASAKTQTLIQCAISFILPKEWNGVHYGGLEKPVFFLDLDCRFDVLRLAEMLKHRLKVANGWSDKVCWQQGNPGVQNSDLVEDKSHIDNNNELFELCMRRFLYVRCYDGLEFLSTLKTLHYQMQKVQKACGIQSGVLMIDSIGAFHWIDRLSSSLALGDHNGKSLSLQNVVQTVVREIKTLLRVHPLLVFATKATILGDRYSMNVAKGKPFSEENSFSNRASNVQELPFREFMPSTWQSLITHRILIRSTDNQFAANEQQGSSTYLLEWLLPQLSSLDRFTVNNVGVVHLP